MKKRFTKIKGRTTLLATQASQNSTKKMRKYNNHVALRHHAQALKTTARKTAPVFATLALATITTLALPTVTNTISDQPLALAGTTETTVIGVNPNPEETQLLGQTMEVPSKAKVSFDRTHAKYEVIAPPPPQISYANVTPVDTYTNDVDAAVQYPFGVGVPITSHYGYRDTKCDEDGDHGCSAHFHAGVDFAPGAGTPIQAIANGVVTEVHQQDDSAYGAHVVITHHIDGQTVTSTYGHIQINSSPLTVGQKVKVGDLVGKVGSTGRSTGPHLHLEIRVNGQTIDPLGWDKWNSGSKW